MMPSIYEDFLYSIDKYLTEILGLVFLVFGFIIISFRDE